MDRNVVRNLPRHAICHRPEQQRDDTAETASDRYGTAFSEHDLVTRGTLEWRGIRAMQRCNGDKYDTRG
jgi:hypothetical protein